MQEVQLDKIRKELIVSTIIANVVHANNQTSGVCEMLHIFEVEVAYLEDEVVVEVNSHMV